MLRIFVISMKSKNGLHALQKIISLITRKFLNVKEIQVKKLDQKDLHSLILKLESSETSAEWLFTQIKKCVDLCEIHLHTNDLENWECGKECSAD